MLHFGIFIFMYGKSILSKYMADSDADYTQN